MGEGMGDFVNDAVEIASLGLIDDPLGIDAAQGAARGAANAQVQASREAIQAQQEAAQRAVFKHLTKKPILFGWDKIKRAGL